MGAVGASDGVVVLLIGDGYSALWAEVALVVQC